MNNLDIEFVQRTQEIVNNYNEKYDFTLLLNCTLGLIILPLEVNREQKLDFLNQRIKEIEIIQSIFDKDPKHIFNPTKFNKKTKTFEAASKNLLTFLYKIRNSLAHFANSKPINENGNWTKIKLKDVNKSNNNNTELELTISENDLKSFAHFLSNAYLNEFKNVQNKS